MSRLVVSLLLAGACCLASAQESLLSAPATVASPTVAEDALMLLAQHQAAVGGVDIRALEGTGTIALAGTSVQLPATIAISGSSFVRVLIQNSTHLTGFAARGSVHKSYYADGSSSIDAVGSGPASICSFQLLRTADTASRLVSLTKDSVTDVIGHHYDVLRARQALTVNSAVSNSSKSKAVEVEYFFDPDTHLLSKSRTMLHIPGISNPIPLETSYSEYRRVGPTMVPFKISQLLNGQPDWVLSLDAASLPTSLKSSLTSF